MVQCGDGRVWARGNPPSLLIPSLSHLLLYLLVSFTFSISYWLHLFSRFSIFSHSTRILPLRFQAGCRSRRLNRALVLCVLILCYMYFQLRMHALFVVFDLVLLCSVIVVSPCCRRQHNNLNEPLDPFPFFGWLLNKTAARVEVNISLAFLHWVEIALHP